jgi:hypothetical protein
LYIGNEPTVLNCCILLKPKTMNQQDLFIEMAIKAWNVQIGRVTKFIDALDDQSLNKAIAPGKNRISYLVGHLVAVNDGMITLFGKGNRDYAHFDEPFVKNPDRADLNTDSYKLRDAWKKSNEQLTSIFSAMTTSDWLGKHTAMTDEDLVKDPGRNKLSVLLNRTSHVAYHLGQLVLAK